MTSRALLLVSGVSQANLRQTEAHLSLSKLLDHLLVERE